MDRTIRLPVATLLKQYKDNNNNLVRHFDLLYVQQGIGRLPVQVRVPPYTFFEGRRWVSVLIPVVPRNA